MAKLPKPKNRYIIKLESSVEVIVELQGGFFDNLILVKSLKSRLPLKEPKTQPPLQV